MLTSSDKLTLSDMLTSSSEFFLVHLKVLNWMSAVINRHFPKLQEGNENNEKQIQSFGVYVLNERLHRTDPLHMCDISRRVNAEGAWFKAV